MDDEIPNNGRRISPDDYMLIPLLKSYENKVNNFRPANIADYVKIYHPSDFKKTSALFALQCHNKDMEPTIKLDSLMVIHPQTTADIDDVVLFELPYGGFQIGKIVKHKGIPGVSLKNKSVDWHPGKNQDLGIVGKIVSVIGDL